MPAEWSTFFAVVCLLLLALFLYRQLHRPPQSREHEYHNTLTNASSLTDKTKWDTLTPRQQEVARLAARGLSNAEIAHELDIKPNTVISHLKKIYSTLDVHSRTELGYKIRDHLD